MGLERFELLELRRDDGIQTFHAREVATARPVQVHVFPPSMGPEYMNLLKEIDRLPDTERRRVIERGEHRDVRYIVTDRLAGYSGIREWLAVKPAVHAALDEQFSKLFKDDPEKTSALPVAAKSALGVLLGFAAALIFLALLIAAFAFRPR
ncbi:MAG: hypothetical protein ACRD30_04275 [Bryobacteraceae bacterium]